MCNFSKISLLFFGAYKNATISTVCKMEIFNFQKFEIISFDMSYYNKKKFNILDGFQDNSNPSLLKGDNKFYAIIVINYKKQKHHAKFLTSSEIID